MKKLDSKGSAHILLAFVFMFAVIGTGGYLVYQKAKSTSNKTTQNAELTEAELAAKRAAEGTLKDAKEEAITSRAAAPSASGSTGTTGAGTATPVEVPKSTGSKVAADSETKIKFASGQATAYVNIAVTEPAGVGWITSYPCGTTKPLTSDLNYDKDQTVSAGTFVKTNASGEVCFYSKQETHLVIDTTFITTSLGVENKVRAFDSRSSGNEKVKVNTLKAISVDISGVSAGDKVYGTIVAISPSAAGYLAITDCTTNGTPQTGTLTFEKGRTSASGFVAQLTASKQLCVYGNAETDLVIDLGRFTDQSKVTMSNARVFDERSTADKVLSLIPGSFKTGVNDKVVVLSLTTLNNSSTTRPNDYMVVYPCTQSHRKISDATTNGDVAKNALMTESSINMTKGEIMSNMVITKSSSSGVSCIDSTVKSDLVVDRLATLDISETPNPTRAFDSRVKQ